MNDEEDSGLTIEEEKAEEPPLDNLVFLQDYKDKKEREHIRDILSRDMEYVRETLHQHGLETFDPET